MVKISKTLISILVCSLAGSAFAGPEWDEGAKVLGRLPQLLSQSPGAQTPS